MFWRVGMPGPAKDRSVIISAAIACGAWSGIGVPIITASTQPLSSMVSKSLN